MRVLELIFLPASNPAASRGARALRRQPSIT
jgi:hypothetical protein